MNNYVLVYQFKNQENADNFSKRIEKVYPDFVVEVNASFIYYGFPARELPDVEYTVAGILQHVGFEDEDYVALYYNREKTPENIKRLMLLGSSDQIEKDLKETGSNLHIRIIASLLEFAFNEIKIS